MLSNLEDAMISWKKIMLNKIAIYKVSYLLLLTIIFEL